MTDGRTIVDRLLAAIDARDWQALGALLTEDSRYTVSGYPSFAGRDAVLHYYRELRPIASGSHRIDGVVAEPGHAVSWGRFAGVKTDGTTVDVLFADVLELSGSCIQARQVYFCEPAEDR